METWKYDPARDHGLLHGERLKSPRRESGLVGVVVRNFWWWGLRGYFATCQSVKVEGRENLPKAAPVILVANHQSHLDALVLACALSLRLRNSVFPIAAGDTFFQTPTARIFAAAAMNALPLWRENAGRHAMEQLRSRLITEPCGYILFPEGTRSRTGQMAAFRAGIGMLIAKSRVPIVPCHLSGTYEAMPPQRRVPRRGRITLRIGKPVVFEKTENNRAGWEEIAGQLEGAVRELGNAINRNDR